MYLRILKLQQSVVLAMIAGLGLAALADAAPQRREVVRTNPTMARRTTSNAPAASITRQPQASNGPVIRRPGAVPPGGVTLDIHPNVGSARPRPTPPARPNTPSTNSPQPRPGLPVPSFQPPSRVPTTPPVVTTPDRPRHPRPSAPIPTFPTVRIPAQPTASPTKPLVIVAEDVEGKTPEKKPLGKLPPEFDNSGAPADSSLKVKLAEYDKPSQQAADALQELFGPSFQDKLADGQLDALINSELGKQYKLGQQWQVKAAGGDVAMALGLHEKLLAPNGWKNAPCLGPINQQFLGGCFGYGYCGPCYYPAHCWCPHWCGWMDWGCWNTCHWYFNPLPYWCQPIAYHPCGGWNFWHCPQWVHLHLVSCGTWWKAPVVHIPASDADLQLLAVRYVDSGHPEQKQGARYRVSIRNNSSKRAIGDFNVMIFAANDERLLDGLPQVGGRVEYLAPGEVRNIDLRLPAKANTMSLDEHGRAVPFEYLHVLVDSHREIFEVFEDNNGATLDRTKILPVDPSAFAVDTNTSSGGDEVTVAGEGFGGMPGRVVVFIGDLSFDAEITGWYDLAVRVKLPEIPLASATDAELVVLRRDGATANPLTVRLLPSQAVSALEPPKP